MFLDYDGKVARLTEIFSDITAPKKNKEILRRLTENLQIANKLLSGIAEGTLDLIAVIDTDYLIATWFLTKPIRKGSKKFWSAYRSEDTALNRI